MTDTRLARALWLPLSLALVACESDPATADSGSVVDALDVVPSDVGDTSLADAADAAEAPDAFTGDGGGTCSFNTDCIASERCECDERTGCRCLPGPRGTGRAGVTACVSGNDCESALCVEATGGGSLCSRECASAGDCPGTLPRCLSVPFVGRFCARDPSATPDASVDAPAGCTGECATTNLMATFGARTGGFNRAQHGADGADRLHLEAHFGGDPACPTPGSRTPDRTLVLSGVRATTDPTPQTEAQGLSATLFDFGGALVSAPLLRATAVRVVPRAYVSGSHVSLEVSVTFAGGTITGGLFAPRCTSLDGT